MSHLRHWRLGGFVLPIMLDALMDLTGIRSSAFMRMCGVVWMSLLWMCRTEVRGAEVMGSKTKSFRLHGQSPPFIQGKS